MKKNFLRVICVGLAVLMVGMICTACGKKGSFIGLEEAFAKGLLTREDMMHIAYFQTGKVIEILDSDGDKWSSELGLPEEQWTVIRKIDFTPQIAAPTLKSKAASDIKKAFYEHNRTGILKGTKEKDVEIYDYFGKYNENYVVQMTAKSLAYGTGSTLANVACFVLIYMGPPITVFSY